MNTFSIDIFERPRFRDKVSVVVAGPTATLDYGDQGCDLDFHEGHPGEVQALLAALQQGGLTQVELQERHPTLAEELPGVLRELDALGLLTETTGARAEPAVTGRQLYAELQRLTERMKRKKAGSTFYQGLVDGTTTRGQLIGYALEYYHVVALAPSVLAPALAWSDTKKSKDLLLSFYESELHHERFLTTALASVNIDVDALEASMPLPATFALCTSLGAYARQHLLTCKAALFLFEQPYDDFNEALRTRCAQLDLPPRFYEPIIRHAALNEDAEHDSITERLLDDVEAVAAEEALVVKKHVAILVETMVRQEEEILQYYGSGDNLSPRIFD